LPTSTHSKLFFFLTALVFLTQIRAVSAAELSEHMKAGQQLFQSKMYRAAISEFEQATKEQPGDATAHYYLAVSHVHAGNVDKAYPHFQQASGLSTTNSQIHQMATSALQSYHAQPNANGDTSSPANSGPLVPSKSYNGGASAELDKMSSSGSSAASSLPAQSTYTPTRNFTPSSFSQSPQALYPQNFNHIPGYQNNRAWGSTGRSRSGMWGSGNNNNHSNYTSGGGSSISTYNTGAAPVTPTLAIYNSSASVPITKDMTAADQALTMIKRQSDTQVRNAANGVHMESYGGSNLNNQTNQIRQNAQAQINQMLTPTYHGRRGYYSTATQAQIDMVNYRAGSQIFNARRDADRADNARQVQQATTEAAANLSDQIREQKLTGSGVMLRAEGTNLHVRNYETFHSDQDDRDAILPMVARPMTLKEAEKSLPVTPLTVPTKHYSIDQ
jgi:hypothetical protein